MNLRAGSPPLPTSSGEVFGDPWVSPGYEVLQTVVDKWGPLVMCALRKGPRRHGELQRAINGVSQKMLTQTLRKLEQFGLVARRVRGTAPTAVQYALTPLGESLIVPLEGLFKWGERHLEEMGSALYGHNEGSEADPGS